MDRRTAFLIASLRDVLEFVKCARNIKDAGAADAAMSDADAMIAGAIDKANAALRVNFKTWTRWNQFCWRFIDWPWGLIRFVWFKLWGVEICDQCWSDCGAANPADPGIRHYTGDGICNACAEAEFDRDQK